MPKFLSGALTGALMGGGIAYANGNFATTVVQVIDDDTLFSRINGDETTIRPLNVDIPETKVRPSQLNAWALEAGQFPESGFLASSTPNTTRNEPEVRR